MPFGFPTCVAGVQGLGLHYDVFPGAFTRSCIESTADRLKVAFSYGILALHSVALPVIPQCQLCREDSCPDCQIINQYRAGSAWSAE